MTSSSSENLTFSKQNPATGELLNTYAIAPKETVLQAIQQSKEAHNIWKETSLALRQKILQKTAVLLKEKVDEWARLVSDETGKPLKDAIETDVTLAVSVLNYYSQIGPKLLKDKRLPLDQSFLLGLLHYERRLSKGVVAIISPWNFPLAIPMSGISAALMAGNTVILKPSELTPGCGEAIGQIIRGVLKDHNLPKDVIQVLTGDGSTGKHLIESDIDYCIFTGSAPTGRSIQTKLTQRGIESSLELGGSCPMIILENTQDLDAATSFAIWSRFVNTGQACAAVKRLYVPANQYDTIIQLLKSKIEKLNQGLPDDPITHLGPLISEPQRNLIARQVEETLAQGAHAETGGKTPNTPGWYYPPTLLSQVPLDAPALVEETFGPVLPVVPYDSVEEAIAMANNTHYGLTASVFGPQAKAEQVARQLQAGTVAINGVGMTNYGFVSLPWGGRKDSGPGISHSAKALLDTTDIQTLTTNLMYSCAFMRKPPWLFNQSDAPQDLEFSKSILRVFGGRSIFAKFDLSMLIGLIKNRSSKRL